MDDLEVFKLSAEACDLRDMRVIDAEPPYITYWTGNPGNFEKHDWNPFTNDSQRWECQKKLLEAPDATLILSGSADAHEFYDGQGEDYRGFNLKCPVEEFFARALAELRKREKGEKGRA